MLVSGEVLAENWSGFLLDVDAQGFIFRFPCGQGFWLVRTINFKVHLGVPHPIGGGRWRRER